MARLPCTRASSRPAMVLNVLARRRTSGGPWRAADRVSSAPLPSRCAAASSADSGRPAHRPTHTAAIAPVTSPPAAIAASTAHSTRSRSFSSAVGRASTTTPTGARPLAASTTTATCSRPGGWVIDTPPCWTARIVARTGAVGPAGRCSPPGDTFAVLCAISRPAALYTQPASPDLLARARNAAMAGLRPGSVTPSSAMAANARAVSTVSCRNEARSRAVVIMPSGTTAPSNSAPTRDSMASAIRRAITRRRGGSPCRTRSRSGRAPRVCAAAPPHARPAPWWARTSGRPTRSPGSADG